MNVSQLGGGGSLQLGTSWIPLFLMVLGGILAKEPHPHVGEKREKKMAKIYCMKKI